MNLLNRRQFPNRRFTRGGISATDCEAVRVEGREKVDIAHYGGNRDMLLLRKMSYLGSHCEIFRADRTSRIFQQTRAAFVSGVKIHRERS